ncbi:MAG: hypothetical protein IT364_16620 [Candidatus Hydrogenedentes bacterium]|nr:hypothetical protein [Candidatus Hydrogenedentota bacterium]
MSKTRHLDRAISILRGSTPPRSSANMRATYEQALRAEGWQLRDHSGYCSEWFRGNNRMIVYNGDKVAISFGRDIRWHFLNATARQRLLLPS